jgi:hypothetical protein
VKLVESETLEKAGFKVICDRCGNLSVKLPELSQQVATSVIRCGKCGEARGTLEELQHLARHGSTDFEF